MKMRHISVRLLLLLLVLRHRLLHNVITVPGIDDHDTICVRSASQVFLIINSPSDGTSEVLVTLV